MESPYDYPSRLVSILDYIDQEAYDKKVLLFTSFPKTYEVYNAMDGIVKKVANYANEDGALGYSFRYFIEGLMEETGVKILSIDGVYPTTENIRDGSYPLSTGLYCLTRANEDDPDVEKVLEFLLSDDGQYIIEETGYVALPNQQ